MTILLHLSAAVWLSLISFGGIVVIAIVALNACGLQFNIDWHLDALRKCHYIYRIERERESDAIHWSCFMYFVIITLFLRTSSALCACIHCEKLPASSTQWTLNCMIEYIHYNHSLCLHAGSRVHHTYCGNPYCRLYFCSLSYSGHICESENTSLVWYMCRQYWFEIIQNKFIWR